MSLGGRTVRRFLAVGVCSAALSLVPVSRSVAAACPALPTPGRGESTTIAPANAPNDWALIVVAAGPNGATVDRFQYDVSFTNAARAKAVGIAVGGDQPHFMYVAGLNQNQPDVVVNLGGMRFERHVRLSDNSNYATNGTDANQRVMAPCARLAYLSFVPGARLSDVTASLTTSRGSTEITTFAGRGGGAIRTSNSTAKAVTVAGVAAGSFKVPFTAQRGVVVGLAQNVRVVRGHWRSPSGATYELGRADPRVHGLEYLTGVAGRWTLAITTDALADAPSFDPGLVGAWADVGELRSLLGYYAAA